jgi:hypothetical protein
VRIPFYRRHMSNPSRATDRPALPPEHAFVVEFTADAETRDDTLSGRVEHVVSGRAVRFDSSSELLAFVQGVLRSRKLTGTAGR